MKRILTEVRLTTIIEEELASVMVEFESIEADGHPLVLEANMKLHAAYMAVEALTSVIFDEGVSADMLKGKTTVHDIASKIKWLYDHQKPHLGVKE